MLSVGDFNVRRKNLHGTRQYRIVPSRYPPIDLFESLVAAEELDVLFEIESMTNDRLRDEVGEISLVPVSDRITGSGASPVMAAFTHIGKPSRFSDGSYGVYYAGLSVETAILETRFHRERFLSQTNEPVCELEMRCYIGNIQLPLHDIRGKAYKKYRVPDISTYPDCQKFAANLREKGSAGLYYKSVRDPGGECIAALKPIAISPVRQGRHYLYKWDGSCISNVLEVKSVF
jgi:hypothetical protein